jgi:hypothetical protein
MRQGAMPVAIRRLIDGESATKIKPKVPRIATRPAAGRWEERADLFSSAQIRAGEGGCLGGRQDNLLGRLAKKGNGRLCVKLHRHDLPDFSYQQRTGPADGVWMPDAHGQPRRVIAGAPAPNQRREIEERKRR